MKRIGLLLLFFAWIGLPAQAQEFHMPQPSPSVKVHHNFSTTFIELEYSRPAVKGREIFGNLIPYGEVWRTGANQATKVTLGEEVTLAGKPVGAGTYALYTIPGEEEWTLILNKGTKNWGASGFDEKENVLEVNLPVEKQEPPQESFLINLENLTQNTGDLVIAWADVRISLPIEADNHQQILQHLEQALQGEKPPYAQAAGYYLATDEKLEDGLKYIQKAIDASPDAYYLYWTKAQLLEKLDRHEEALEAAKKAADITEKGHPVFKHEYRRNYEDLKNKEG